MKDIENYNLPRLGEALRRLEGAVTRLDAAATNNAPASSFAKKSEEAERKLADLGRSHEALKEAASHVATRLDLAIGRLSASLDQAGD